VAKLQEPEFDPEEIAALRALLKEASHKKWVRERSKERWCLWRVIIGSALATMTSIAAAYTAIVKFIESWHK